MGLSDYSKNFIIARQPVVWIVGHKVGDYFGFWMRLNMIDKGKEILLDFMFSIKKIMLEIRNYIRNLCECI